MFSYCNLSLISIINLSSQIYKANNRAARANYLLFQVMSDGLFPQYCLVGAPMLRDTGLVKFIRVLLVCTSNPIELHFLIMEYLGLIRTFIIF